MPYITYKKVALRRITNNIKCKTVLNEQSINTYLYMKYLDYVFMTNMLQEKKISFYLLLECRKGVTHPDNYIECDIDKHIRIMAN